MTQLETKSFLLTVSVKGDLSVESEEKVVKYLRKNTLMHHAVIEMGEHHRRHLHACFIYKEGCHKHKVQNNVWTRFVKPYHEDSIGKFAVKVQVCPGNKWYHEYLQKEQDVQVLSTNWDPSAAEEHFPTPAVQEALQAKASINKTACPAVEARVIEWSTSSFENTPEGAAMFIKHCMNVAKTMVPISDKRKLVEKARMYYEYRNGITFLTERELWLLKQLDDGPSYDVPTLARAPNGAAPPSI